MFTHDNFHLGLERPPRLAGRSTHSLDDDTELPGWMAGPLTHWTMKEAARLDSVSKLSGPGCAPRLFRQHMWLCCVAMSHWLSCSSLRNSHSLRNCSKVLHTPRWRFKLAPIATRGCPPC